mgnify:CR=1 FL=1
MTDVLTLATESGATSFEPGSEITVRAEWHLEEVPRSVELRLVWYTEGKGSQDVGVVERVLFDAPGDRDSRRQSLQLPTAPYSFSGSLVSLIWAVELLVEPGELSTRLDLDMAPGAREILLHAGSGD